nr:ParA family protein [uncultured Capnocytophaga sp.]
MIITFATQKGGVGKTTLAVAFANYLSIVKKKEVKVFDFDFQKSFFQKWKEDEMLSIPALYEVEVLGDPNTQEEILLEYQDIMDMKQSETYYLFDLAGTLDARYGDLLVYSDFIVIPFEYSDVSVKSTMVFINFLGMIESQAARVFVRSKYDKGYFYRNQEAMDEEISKYGELLPTPIYKRNDLQSINTRRLSYEQRSAVKRPFEELIQYINESI